jgi:reductive dehalogenase
MVVQMIHITIGATIVAFFVLFAVSSVREGRRRAAWLSSIFAVTTISVWGVSRLPDSVWLMLLPDIFAVAVVILFFAPLGRLSAMQINLTGERVDERDIMFAREEYEPGSEKYHVYYSMRPEKEEVDKRWRKLPEILEPGGRYYVADQAAKITEMFEQLERMTTEVDGDVAPHRREISSEFATDELKKRTWELGAVAVGVARLNQAYVYSHVGRGPQRWGEPIDNQHQYAIAFTVEMDYRLVEQAPGLPITGETARRYLQAAEISIELARGIRSWGYPARAHIAGSNYQVMLPPVAQDAGLGELGRLGYLITPDLGPRVRLGAVTTDLPLIPDRPGAFGVQDFCAECRKCAVNCPSNAIPHGEKVDVRGTLKWQLEIERCYHYWRLAGTDCGLCMKVCPYSHPASFVHNLVRTGIERSHFARKISLWGDDLFYGHKLTD